MRVAQRDSDLAANLRYLCGYYRSVSEVCREIGVNRQQFNKYISGHTSPSLHTLRKISDFFSLDIDEICLPHEELRQIFEARRSMPPGPRLFTRRTLIDEHDVGHLLRDLGTSFFRSDASVLAKLCGIYHRYHYAFDNSGRVVRSLFRIAERDGLYTTKLVERIHHHSNGSNRYTTLKYEGVVMAMSGCVFNVEYETLMRSCIGYAAFANFHRPGQRFLLGLQTSFSSSSGKPTATRVVLERIPVKSTTRALLSKCGMFPKDSEMIDPDILRLIGNDGVAHDRVFSLNLA